MGLCFEAVYNHDLADSQASGDTSVSVSHTIVSLLGCRYTTGPGFMQALGIQTPIFMLAQQVLYPLSHLPSL